MIDKCGKCGEIRRVNDTYLMCVVDDTECDGDVWNNHREFDERLCDVCFSNFTIRGFTLGREMMG